MPVTRRAVGGEPIVPEDFRHWEIDTADGTLEFEGKLLGAVNNERRGRSRWAEIELYKYIVTDEGDPAWGKQAYLLYTLGHSVVYHRYDSACNQGVAVPVEEFPLRAEFPDDLEPCQDTLIRGRVAARGCHPQDWRTAPAGTMFDLEVLRHLQFFCATAVEVLRQLRRPTRVNCEPCRGRGAVIDGTQGEGKLCPACDGRGTVAGERALSAPGQRLIEIVRFRDPDVAQAANRVVKL